MRPPPPTRPGWTVISPGNSGINAQDLTKPPPPANINQPAAPRPSTIPKGLPTPEELLNAAKAAARIASAGSSAEASAPGTPAANSEPPEELVQAALEALKQRMASTRAASKAKDQPSPPTEA